MADKPLYPSGRASAFSGGDRTDGSIDYALIKRLRAIRASGDLALRAAEQYDPDFSIKLSNCIVPGHAEALLTEWLNKRAAVLDRTQAELRRVWTEAQADRNSPS